LSVAGVFFFLSVTNGFLCVDFLTQLLLLYFTLFFRMIRPSLTVVRVKKRSDVSFVMRDLCGKKLIKSDGNLLIRRRRETTTVEEETMTLLPKDFDPHVPPAWLLPPPSAEILFRGPPNLGVRQPLVSSSDSLSWETFVSWPPPERRNRRRMQQRRENKNENLSATSDIVFFNNNNKDDDEEVDEEEMVEFALDERWAKRFAETERKRRERREAREREKREEQPVSGRVERARAKAEETMRTWEALE